LAHECQTTWQNMEMDTGKFRNLQDSGRWNSNTSPVEIFLNSFLSFILLSLPLL